MRDLRADALHATFQKIGPARDAVHQAADDAAASVTAQNGPQAPANPQTPPATPAPPTPAPGAVSDARKY